MQININKRTGFKLINFPDGQPHIILDSVVDGNVICSIKNPNDLFLLLLVSNALDNKFIEKNELCIPYLMGARYDRVMNDGDSFDLKVISDMINYCGFKRVALYDSHSYVSTALIKNSTNYGNEFLIREYKLEDSILICPDTGASKNIDRYMKDMIAYKNVGGINEPTYLLEDVVYCIKNRDKQGNISLSVLEPEKCVNRNCVIIDDLCDGGGTFLAIAKQIRPKNLTLIVTHGIFSKGLDIFKGYIDQIIVSNSYAEHNHELVKTINKF